VAATLAQIIAVEEGVRASTDKWQKLVFAELAKEQVLYGKDYTHEAFEGGITQPPEKQKVRLNTAEMLAEVQEKLGRLFDVSATRDMANTGATADVVVGGDVLLEAMPTTFLLFLEKRLAELAAAIRAMPTQNPAVDWEPTTEPGIWRTAPVTRQTTTQEVEFKIVSPAEGMRPAQYEAVPRHVVTGQWTRVELTSALTARESAAILARLTVLLEAVKMARIEANRIDAPDVKAGQAIFGYVFGDGAQKRAK
jgi:hypothetical protein